jgi:hypothetical protein
LCTHAPQNGFSFLIIPAGSRSHIAYAENAPSYEGMFVKPVVGWIAGVHTSRIGKQAPMVFSGISFRNSTEHAVAMHVGLPQDKIAELDIVNVFEPGSGDSISFPASGFSAQQCLINGKPASFARYLADIKHDCRLPLTADYNGSVVNVSLQSIDASSKTVKFYAPVFSGVEYRLARPVPDYVAAFESALREHRGAAAFTCGCILNYLYAELEGKPSGLICPVTFGEIAHQLLNQTVVRLLIRDSTVRQAGQT